MILGVPYQSFPSSFQRDLLAAEHWPNNLPSFITQMMALKDSPTAPVVRPAYNTAVKIKQLLGAGFYKFLIPFVISAEEGRSAVSATCYPSRGIPDASVCPCGSRNCTVTNRCNFVHDHICADTGEVFERVFPLAAKRIAV